MVFCYPSIFLSENLRYFEKKRSFGLLSKNELKTIIPQAHKKKNKTKTMDKRKNIIQHLEINYSYISLKKKLQT